MTQTPLQVVCQEMEARGHSYTAVYDFLLYLLSLTPPGQPTKLQAYIDAGPDHFERAFRAWHEQQIERWQQLRCMIEEMA